MKEIDARSIERVGKETEYLTQATDPEGRYYCSKSDCEGVKFNSPYSPYRLDELQE